jgi:hypothetical protein
MTASMPRGVKPAAQSAAPEFVNLQRAARISGENKIDDLFRGVPFSTVEYETIPSLIVCLKERKRRAVLSGDYMLSQQAENMIVRLSSMQLQKKFNAVKQVKLKELNKQLDQAQGQIKAIIEKWNKKIQAFNAQQAAAASELERKHLEKLGEFDASVPTALPSEYCKLSAPLLDLREQERQLVLSKRYDEAVALKKESDRREKEEAEQQKAKFLQIVAGRRQKLTQEQEHAIDCFTSRWTRLSAQLEQERDAEIQTQQKIVDNIQLKVAEIESEELAA